MGSTAYIGSCAGKFYAFDVPTGEVLWSYDVSVDGAEQFHGNPVVVDSLIVVGTDMGNERRGTLYALDLATGVLRWKLPSDPGLPSDLVVRGRQALATLSFSDALISVNLDDGKIAWRYDPAGADDPDFEVQGGRIPRLRSNPLLVDDTILFAPRDNTMHAIDADTGKLLWKRSLPFGVTTDLCPVDGGVALGTDTGEIVLMNPSDGTTARSFELDVMPVAAMNYQPPMLVFLAGGNRPRDVVALDFSSGSVEWRQTLEDPDPEAYWYVPRIHTWGTAVIVGSTHGLVTAFDFDLGEPLWSSRLKGAIRGMGHVGDILLVGTFEGNLYALRLR